MAVKEEAEVIVISLTTRVASLAEDSGTKRDEKAHCVNDVKKASKHGKIMKTECDSYIEELTQLRVKHGKAVAKCKTLTATLQCRRRVVEDIA